VAGAPNTGYSAPSPARHTAPQAAPSVVCRTEYVTLWDTQYQETETQVCTTEYDKVCHTETQRLCQPTTRTVCNTVYEKQCTTVYKNVCVEQFKTEYEPYTETECVTEYKEDCEYRWEGSGNSKVWAPIPGTCKSNPYDNCHEVSKTKAKQVAYPVCHDVPEEKCVDVPKEVCHEVPDQVCHNAPLQKCQDVPRESCHAVHKKVPVRVSRQAPKKVCDEGYNAVPAVPAKVPPFVPSGETFDFAAISGGRDLGSILGAPNTRANPSGKLSTKDGIVFGN